MAAEKSAGLRNTVVAESEICDIDGVEGKLIYRGYDIHDLAQNTTFEEVSYLLWYGKLPNRDELAKLDATLKAARVVPQPVLDMIASMPAAEEPMNVLRTAVSYLSAFDEDTGRNDAATRIAMSKRLTGAFASVVAAIARARDGKPYVEPDNSLGHAANFLWQMTGEKPDELAARTMDVALILHAEHGFNASTFTARVVAATESDMYSSVVAAIGALKGPLHGGANTEVMNMLLEIEDPAKVDSYVAAKLERKEKIMGMGHAVYKAFDPRATELQKLSEQMAARAGDAKWLGMSDRIWRIVNEQKGLWPNVDFFSASTYYTMGIKPELYTLLFAVSRITGWSAHIIEQLANNKLIRPSSTYTGPRGLTVAPIDQR